MIDRGRRRERGARRGAPLVSNRPFGPFQAVSTPGHAPDHFALIAERGCFTGDAVLGEGSVFISPHPGAMSGYLLGLEHLRARADFDVLWQIVNHDLPPLIAQLEDIFA